MFYFGQRTERTRHEFNGEGKNYYYFTIYENQELN